MKNAFQCDVRHGMQRQGRVVAPRKLQPEPAHQPVHQTTNSLKPM